MKKIGSYIFAALAVPAVSFAQTSGLITVLDRIQNILDAVIPIIITLAVIYFFWGLAQYILESGNAEKKEEGRNKMIWGIIALFVMVSIWGLLGLIAGTFGIQTGGSGGGFIPTV